MKKNIIMVIIILICSMSLLLVLYYFNSKNIYYISDKIIDNNKITMQIKSGSTYTSLETLNDLDSSKYYRISNETNCTSGTASFYYSNSTNKLKLKVTSNPLKCKIVFEEIREDINIVAMSLNGSDIQNISELNANQTYMLDSNSGCNGNAAIIWNDSLRTLEVKGATSQTFCTANFVPSKIVAIAAQNATVTGGKFINNSLVNGGFEDGTTGWYVLGTAVSVTTENPYKGTYSGKKIFGSYNLHYFRQNPELKTKHLYYYSLYGLNPGSNNLTSDVANLGGSFSTLGYTTSYTRFSSFYRSTVTKTSHSLSIWYGIATLEDAYIDNIMFSDLTSAFGYGNEPSKAWCDKNIPFFEENASIKSNNILTNSTTTTFTVTPDTNMVYNGSLSYCTTASTITVSGTTVTITVPSTNTNTLCTLVYE